MVFCFFALLRNPCPSSGNEAAWDNTIVSRREACSLSVCLTITVPLPDEYLAFLRAWSEKQGTSAEEFLARQARNLREHLQRPLHPDVVAATGIISPEADEETYHQYLEKKYL